MLIDSVVDIEFIYGNRHELVPAKNGSDNKHRWTAFIKAKDPKIQANLGRIIDKVNLGLHPTFGVDHVVMKPDGGNNI